MTVATNIRKASVHPAFGLFDEACGTATQQQIILKLCREVEKLPAEPFSAGNAITHSLLEKGWRYGLHTYCLKDMLSLRAGNCLGLSALYGALLTARGFQPEYELVIGPQSYQSRDEQELLEHLLSGQAFSFHSPVLPERQEGGEKLLFCTQEHPRLVLGGELFETTALQQQGPSDIRGQRVRKLNYTGLMGLVYYERAHQALINDARTASRLLAQARKMDPDNHGVFAEETDLSLASFDDDLFDRASKQLRDSDQKDSKNWLQKYCLFGVMSDLEKALGANPTDMCAWPMKHVLCEGDVPNQRANFAVAAQCIARSEILNLGNYYATYAARGAKLFPDHVVSLVKKSRDKSTNPFGHHLALALLGSCRGVVWKGRDKPHDHLAELNKRSSAFTPFQRTLLLYAAKRLSEGNGAWEKHLGQFGERKTFKATVDLMDRQWQGL
ncbi:MAG: hypothetical protein EXS52_01640 [Candidatus Staskawiczbacteria bacterium]|nr:hypothetical protein [Candidatus Staskawiczbacteria bacterium]